MTSCNPFTVVSDIEKTFRPYNGWNLGGSSLKLTCMSSQQKDIVLNCTHIGDIEVVASIPNAEARKQQQEAGHSRAERVVISGVSIDDDSIQEATEAAQVYRISKRGQSGDKIPTTSVVLSYTRPLEEVPSRVAIGYLTFRTRTYIPLVRPLTVMLSSLAT